MRDKFVSRLRPQLARCSMGCILAAMTLLGLWGHKTHWSLSHSEAAEPTDLATPSETASTAQSEMVGHGTCVELRSVESLDKCGIRVAPAEVRPMSAEVVANGVVHYDQTKLAQLTARVAGTVWRVEKLVGQPIKKGDVLAIIDAVEVGRVKADLLQAIVAERLKAATAERLKAAGAAIPERQVREAEAALGEARIKLFNAQQTLVNLGLPVALEDLAGLSTEELANRVHFLGLPDSLRSTLDPKTTTANLLPLIAPFDGIVIGQNASLGERVDDTGHHFEIADISRMWVMLDVQKEHAAKVRLGQRVTFTVDGVSERLESTVAWISTQVDEKTRTLSIRCAVENPVVHVTAGPGEQDSQRLLHANTFGTGLIVTDHRDTAVTVPAQAVQRDGEEKVVFVRTSECSFEPRNVKIGLLDDGHLEIVQGLQPGEVVATDGSHVLKSEVQRIRLVSGNAP